MEASNSSREFLWGAVAGSIGEGIFHPFDLQKTRMQAAEPGHQKVSLGSLWTREGTRGMYRGLGPALTGSMATGATYFGTIDLCRVAVAQTVPDLEGPWFHFLAGAFGEGLGSIVYVPCEVIKQRMQIQGSSSMVTDGLPKPFVFKSMFHGARYIVKTEGMKGLYVGYGSTVARDLPFAGFQIAFYEMFKKGVLACHGKGYHWGHQNLGDLHQLSAQEELTIGGLAGGVACFLTTPLDVIKTRLQTQGVIRRYRGWIDAASKILANEGPSAFFNGARFRLAWFVPSSAIAFGTLGLLRRTFGGSEGSVVPKGSRKEVVDGSSASSPYQSSLRMSTVPVYADASKPVVGTSNGERTSY